jgi:hypothetical protein
LITSPSGVELSKRQSSLGLNFLGVRWHLYRPFPLNEPQGTIEFGVSLVSWEMYMATVEERLEQLEKEVTLLKLSKSNKVDLAAKKPGWIAKIEGSFKDDPDFAEILRLGREERQTDILDDE